MRGGTKGGAGLRTSPETGRAAWDGATGSGLVLAPQRPSISVWVDKEQVQRRNPALEFYFNCGKTHIT